MNGSRCILALLALCVCGTVSAQRVERIPFGDFESWTVREIKESAILGGETKIIYALAPTDTIRKNEVFNYENTIWSSSNAYAVVMGITKTNCSVTPAKGPDGLCAKPESCYADVKVALVLDYKSVLPNTGRIAKGFRTYDGYDPEEIILIPQNRWEDEKGNVHVKRVGTAAERMCLSLKRVY